MERPGNKGKATGPNGSHGVDPGILSTAAAVARRYGMEYAEALRMTMRIWGVARSMITMGRGEGDERWRGLTYGEKAEVCGTAVRALLETER